jgi:phospholipid/cholesterol/gamma-HCH transport system substrate-binding protein
MSRLIQALVASVCAVTLSGCVSLHPNDHVQPGQVAVGADGYTVKARFTDLQNVVPNSTVQHDDVVVGTVAKIKVVDWNAEVTLRLKKSVVIPANATFRIGQKTLLGAQYIDVIDPVKPRGRMRGGAVIAAGDTGSYPGTEQVLAGVSLLLNNGGLSQLSTITSELNRTLDNRVPDTRQLIAQLNQLLGTLDDRKAEVIGALESLESLSKRISSQDETIARAVDAVAPGLTSLARERHALTTTLETLGELSMSATKVIDSSQDALLANLSSLRPVLAKLAESGSNVTNSLKYIATVPFPLRTTSNAMRGDYTNIFTTIDVSTPALLEAFVGNAASPTPADDLTDPLRAPLGLDGGVLDLVRPPGGVEPSARPTAKPRTATPDPAECGFLNRLLGGW